MKIASLFLLQASMCLNCDVRDDAESVGSKADVAGLAARSTPIPRARFCSLHAAARHQPLLFVRGDFDRIFQARARPGDFGFLFGAAKPPSRTVSAQQNPSP